MSSIWGEQIKISVFGESHGSAIGVVIDGLPPGIPLDINHIRKEMERRKPGQDRYSTPRSEEDTVEVVSGFFQGYTTGTPLCGMIRNTDKRSKDYSEIKDLMRPGHADFSGRVRYKGFGDYRGGGHFSGRLTAPIVFAGAIASQYLMKKGITVGTHLYRIGQVSDSPMDSVNITKERLMAFRQVRFPAFSQETAEQMKAEIEAARMEGDSVGGILETAIVNLPTGLGSPLFHSVESKISAFVFSIPGTKGIEFGSGFEMASMRGSEANDPFYIEGDTVKTSSNHTGGINGGITNGMPVLFKTAFRPTPSIAKTQRTIHVENRAETELTLHGRHDPCIALRAVPVMDAVSALVVMDLLLETGRK